MEGSIDFNLRRFSKFSEDQKIFFCKFEITIALGTFIILLKICKKKISAHSVDYFFEKYGFENRQVTGILSSGVSSEKKANNLR